MKFKIDLRGPYGANQSTETITKSFDTEAERDEFKTNFKSQLSVIVKVYEGE